MHGRYASVSTQTTLAMQETFDRNIFYMKMLDCVKFAYLHGTGRKSCSVSTFPKHRINRALREENCQHKDDLTTEDIHYLIVGGPLRSTLYIQDAGFGERFGILSPIHGHR